MRYFLPYLIAFVTLWTPYTGRLEYFRSRPVASNANEMEAFFDGLMPAQINDFHIPGGVVSIVQNGRLVFAKGYGFADIQARRPVVADKTLFRLASISKLFVWTAVMQLVEQEKLDLNADVNIYLKDFQIPATYPEPVTLLDLMNHTPGFEERALGTSTHHSQDIQPLGGYLRQHMPARVRPPGELSAYSNYGAALAGYIVSQVSGMPFDQYVAERIFKPLKMQHSTFRQPPPGDLALDLAIGYAYMNGGYAPQDREWAQLAPAASLSATATDMANFMIAQLQNGRFGNTRILQADTAMEMHQQSFTNDPRLDGYAHGFAEGTINGQRILWHGGDILNFHSLLVLLPEQGSGFFVSFNGANGMLSALSTLRAVMDQLYPDQQPAPETPANLNDDAGSYAGAYFPTRAEYTTAGKMVRMFQGIQVTVQSAHQLRVSLGFPAQVTWQYLEIAPGVFRSTDVPPSIFGDVVFRNEGQRGAQYLFQHNNPTTAYFKAPWYAEPAFNLSLLGITTLLFLSVILWAPLGWWIRRRYGEVTSSPSRLASWWEMLLSLSGLLFLAGFAIIFSSPQTVFGLSPWARPLFLLPLVIAILAIGMIVFTLLAWTRRWWSMPGRMHYTLVTFAALAFVWWLFYWNLWIGYLR